MKYRSERLKLDLFILSVRAMECAALYLSFLPERRRLDAHLRPKFGLNSVGVRHVYIVMPHHPFRPGYVMNVRCEYNYNGFFS
jgi:hypothetical protein